jgi:hypothetical protein
MTAMWQGTVFVGSSQGTLLAWVTNTMFGVVAVALCADGERFAPADCANTAPIKLAPAAREIHRDFGDNRTS